ncbi:NACHT domain-containing protein [Acinetobacter variabilis]|uniref:NACHT domain-containing protein n=1 Tax=Acinetobacter variabilis TaxID=70346 RepID=UPI003A84661A
MLNRNEIITIYQKYGFNYEKNSDYKDVLVFTLQSGHYHNADIINLAHPNNIDNLEKAFDEYSEAGYACIKRKYDSIDNVKNSLFDGFFSVKNTKKHLKREYDSHVKQIIGSFPDGSTYKYIDSTYEINNKIGEKNVVEEISTRLNENKPILFIIEAAAGFGKTCTAYELLSNIINNEKNMIPLFSELSRNRQAKIFHYVLLDEIDRSFPNLNSQLVKDQILNGKVPVILDGFDELLHDPNQKDETKLSATYNTEPMLKTISDLLKDSAKIILTTRRTALFDGNDFTEWVEEHNELFDIYRIKINEPTITDWLPNERFQKLKQTNYPILKLNNPVLLSYLRFINDQEFETCIADPQLIVDKYFLSMLERERKRQDLQILPEDQSKILQEIAQYLISNNYTAEEKEFLHIYIEEKFEQFLEGIRKYYQAEDRPTIDELINKLTSHALLDRSGMTENKIGFVNDFVLGHYVVPNILDTQEWIGDKIFIEPAVLATTPTSEDKRAHLWKALETYFHLEDDLNFKVNISIKLINGVFFPLEDAFIDRISINNITLGTDPVRNFTFYNCTFTNVSFNLDNFDTVVFVECKFFNSTVTGSCESLSKMGCSGQDDEFFNLLDHLDKEEELEVDDTLNLNEIEIYILEKFWPKGRSTFHKHRHHNFICGNSRFKLTELISSIKNLKRRKILLTPVKEDFYELNIENINLIKTALGKND